VGYSARAIARRRCLGTTKTGNPCRAWALWDDPRQLCVNHAGRGHTGPMEGKRRSYPRGRYTPCRCEAYAWPHRPAAGLCRWPDPPEFRLTTPAGTKNPDNWIWPVGEVVRVERGESRQSESPRTRPVIVGENWTREEEIADIMRRIGRLARKTPTAALNRSHPRILGRSSGILGTQVGSHAVVHVPRRAVDTGGIGSSTFTVRGSKKSGACGQKQEAIPTVSTCRLVYYLYQ
jgi:hypothetical protein